MQDHPVVQGHVVRSGASRAGNQHSIGVDRTGVRPINQDIDLDHIGGSPLYYYVVDGVVGLLFRAFIIASFSKLKIILIGFYEGSYPGEVECVKLLSLCYCIVQEGECLSCFFHAEIA